MMNNEILSFKKNFRSKNDNEHILNESFRELDATFLKGLAELDKEIRHIYRIIGGICVYLSFSFIGFILALIYLI